MADFQRGTPGTSRTRRANPLRALGRSDGRCASRPPQFHRREICIPEEGEQPGCRRSGTALLDTSSHPEVYTRVDTMQPLAMSRSRHRQAGKGSGALRPVQGSRAIRSAKVSKSWQAARETQQRRPGTSAADIVLPGKLNRKSLRVNPSSAQRKLLQLRRASGKTLQLAPSPINQWQRPAATFSRRSCAG